jgi:hypothetical protein
MQVLSLTARAQEELTKLKLPSECGGALHFGALASGYPCAQARFRGPHRRLAWLVGHGG